MLGIDSLNNLAKMVKVWGDSKHSQSEWLLKDNEEDVGLSSSCSSSSCRVPTGFFTLYIGDERRRFVVPLDYLSHPLFKMMLNKSSEEFGFNQKNGLAIPCSVNAFREMVSVVESCNGKFDLSHLVQEFI
ncbi:hypothetical protein L6452_03643 [Arctium lappa]|uniref:Uncharacterized protein n=1 Tax=Arctium lappa TaxID=4217 RepID=A0ACB9FMR3_ARCLA|nr:hypothetical protein L6452_03643 [Arctium lappa]